MEEHPSTHDETSLLAEESIRRHSMGCCNARTSAIVSGVVAASFLGLAIGFPYLFDFVLEHELTLVPGTIANKMWRKAPIPMYIRFYLYNVTNSQDIMKDPNTIPVVEEIGPYTYQEWHDRVFVHYHDNYTVTFHQNRTWKFVPELSNGSELDPIIVLNTPLVSAAYMIRNEGFFIKEGFNVFIKKFGSKLFVETNVGDILFNGYEDPLLEFVYEHLLPLFPQLPAYDRFGWFYNRSGNPYFDGVYNVYTGGDDVMKTGVIAQWNYESTIAEWEGPCAMLNGSFGESFPPRAKPSSISLFAVDLCRSVELEFKENITTFGVKNYRYWGGPTLFMNETDNPDNWCFAPKGWSGGVPSGLQDSSACRYGAPAYVSFPRFLHADPWLREQVLGVPEPDEDRHMFNIDMEPKTGVPFEVNARFQINIMAIGDKYIDVVKNYPVRYYPVMWFEVNARMSEKLASYVSFVLVAPTIGIAVLWSLMGVTLLLSVFFAYRHFSTKKKNTLTVFDNESESVTGGN